MAPGKESPTRARGEDELDIMEGAAAIGAGLPADSDSGSTSASSAAASGRPTTEAPPDVDDQFLCITVREAKGLVAKDYETASSDPFAKITLGPNSKKSRVIYRNRHPMWQQRLIFPIESLDEGEPLLVELWDKDAIGIEFLGQVIMTLGKALEIAEDPATGLAYWFPLAKKRSTDVVAGKLCLGFEVLDALTYSQVVAEVEAEMDQDAIVAALGSRALLVQLHGLNGLKANSLGLMGSQASSSPARTATASPRGGGGGRPKVWPKAKSLYIRFGRFCLEKPLPSEFEEPGGEFEVAINEQVLIPLAPALRLSSLSARRKDELFDIKVYVKGATHTIAKTQIPIWDVPDDCDDAAGAQLPGDDDAASEAPGSVPAGAPASGRVTPQPDSTGGRVTPPPAAAAPALDAARSASGRLTPPLAALPAAGAGQEPPGSVVAAAAAVLAKTAPAARLERVSPMPASGPSFQRPSWLGGPVAPGAGDPAAAVLSKKRLDGGSESEPASPRGALPGSAAFTIPAHQPGDCASEDDAASDDGLPLRARSETAAGRDGGLSRTSAGSVSKAAAAAVTPLQRKRSGASGAAGGAGGGELSRRLRSMLAPGTREVSRMGWAPLKPSASTGEDCDAVMAAAASSGAAAAAAGAQSGAQAAGLAAVAAVEADARGAGWQGVAGKRYQRTLESHLALTAGNLEVSLSLRLVPLPASPAAAGAAAVASVGAARVLEDEDDDEDVPDATPLVPPAPLDIAVVDTTVNLGVNSLYSLMFGPDSAFMAAFWASEDLREVSAGPWGPPGDANPAAGCAAALRMRRVAYVKPLRIPIPLAPKQCHVWEEHRLVAKSDGGWVVECKCTNDAPKGDCFYVLVQLCGVHRASGAAQLRITMQMVFLKQCLGKSMIQNGAESDSKRSWAALVAALQRHAAAGPAPALPAPLPRPVLAAGGAGAAAIGGLAAGAAVGGTSMGKSRGRAARAGSRLLAHLKAPSAPALAPGAALRLLLVASILVLAAAVYHAGRGVACEMRELSVALRAAADAGCGGVRR